jgi:hypothetical protein
LDCRDILEFALPSLFINVNNALWERNGDIGFKQFKYFYSHFALDIFNAKQFDQKIIEKFNDESPKSVKRIGSGCFKTPI